MFLQFAAAALTYLSSLWGHPPIILVRPIPVKIISTSHVSTPAPIPQTTAGLTILSMPSPTPPLSEVEVLAATPSATATPAPTHLLVPTITTTPSPTLTPTATLAPTTALTPTPPQTQTTSVASPGDLDTIFSKYADQYHADKNLMQKIAKCESSFNTNAEYMGYAGMFQFAASSWSSVRGQMGADPNPDLRKNAEEAIKTAAYMIGNGHSSAWPTCEK